MLFFLLLSKLQRGRWEEPIGVLRDWLPIVLVLVAFREMELFVPAKYTLALETGWIKLDQLVLHDWGWRALIEWPGRGAAVLPGVLLSAGLRTGGVFAWVHCVSERPARGGLLLERVS